MCKPPAPKVHCNFCSRRTYYQLVTMMRVSCPGMNHAKPDRIKDRRRGYLMLKHHLEWDYQGNFELRQAQAQGCGHPYRPGGLQGMLAVLRQSLRPSTLAFNRHISTQTTSSPSSTSPPRPRQVLPRCPPSFTGFCIINTLVYYTIMREPKAHMAISLTTGSVHTLSLCVSLEALGNLTNPPPPPTIHPRSPFCVCEGGGWG